MLTFFIFYFINVHPLIMPPERLGKKTLAVEMQALSM